MKYTVYVDDNFHYRDESARCKHTEFDSCAEAIEECKKIVEEYFDRLRGSEGKISFEELWQGYQMYGEDPFIVTEDATCKFSAWDHAKQRCLEMARKN